MDIFNGKNMRMIKPWAIKPLQSLQCANHIVESILLPNEVQVDQGKDLNLGHSKMKSTHWEFHPVSDVLRS